MKNDTKEVQKAIVCPLCKLPFDGGTIIIAMIVVSTLPLLIAGICSLISDIITGMSIGNFQPLLLTIGLFGPMIAAIIIAKRASRRML
jgi:hypothetical protein